MFTNSWEDGTAEEVEGVRERGGARGGRRGEMGIEGEFRQHDGVVTMMRFYRCRASPKHCYNIIEEDYGGGGHRTRLRDQ